MWSSFFFFFKQKTAYEMRISDWSSDVCSSDLAELCRTRQGQLARLFRLDARGHARGRICRAVERLGPLHPAPDARRGDVFARAPRPVAARAAAGGECGVVMEGHGPSPRSCRAKSSARKSTCLKPSH